MTGNADKKGKEVEPSSAERTKVTEKSAQLGVQEQDLNGMFVLSVVLHTAYYSS